MKYKVLFYFVISSLLAYFWFNVYNLNLNSVSNTHELLNITSSYSGYHYLLIMGSVYVVIYLFILEFDMKYLLLTQSIVRHKRRIMVIKLTIKTLKSSIIFTSLLIGINFVLIIYFVDMNVLIENNFFISECIYYINCILLYFIVGLTYILFYLIFDASMISIIITFFINIFIVSIDLIFNINTIYSAVVVFDYTLNNGLNSAIYFFNVIKFLLSIIFLISINYLLFKGKDFINE